MFRLELLMEPFALPLWLVKKVLVLTKVFRNMVANSRKLLKLVMQTRHNLLWKHKLTQRCKCRIRSSDRVMKLSLSKTVMKVTFKTSWKLKTPKHCVLKKASIKENHSTTYWNWLTEHNSFGQFTIEVEFSILLFYIQINSL